MKLACETCPVWTYTHTVAGDRIGGCHHSTQSHLPETAADWWCSLHPAAPQPVYEVLTDLSLRSPGSDWEPVNLAITAEGYNWVLWRRIVGYTKGGE